MLRARVHVRAAKTCAPAYNGVFKKNAAKYITRAGVSDFLKLAADACAAGMPMGRVASHSLRGGGATQVVASGLSDEHAARFGRWKSDAYKAYAFGHSDLDAMKASPMASLLRAVQLVPRLGRN